MIFGINTTHDISKLSQISLAYRLVKLRITILKYHSWYFCQIPLLIMLLPIQIIFLCDYFLYIMPNFTCTFASDFNPFTIECRATFNSNG